MELKFVSRVNRLRDGRKVGLISTLSRLDVSPTRMVLPFGMFLKDLFTAKIHMGMVVGLNNLYLP